MKLLDSLKQSVTNTFVSKKQELKSELLKYGEEVLVRYVLPNVSDFVRAIIVSKGKNPDYVPPPPPPPEIKKPSETRPSFRFNPAATPAWVRESFKKPSKHPILQSRAELEREGLKTEPPPEEDGLFVTASAANGAPVDLSAKMRKLQELANKVRDKYNEHVEVEPLKKEVKKAPKPTKKAAKKSKKKTTKRAKVVRTFNGSFRRIEE